MVDTFKLGRFTITKGDAVAVLPSRSGKEDGFSAIVTGARLNDDGTLKEVYVHGGKKNPASRSFLPTRVRYMQPKTQKPIQDAAAHLRDILPKPLPPKGRKHGR